MRDVRITWFTLFSRLVKASLHIVPYIYIIYIYKDNMIWFLHSRRTKDLWYTSCQEGLHSNLVMLKWGSRTLSPPSIRIKRSHDHKSNWENFDMLNILFVFFLETLFFWLWKQQTFPKNCPPGSFTTPPWVRFHPRIASQVLVALELGEPGGGKGWWWVVWWDNSCFWFP